MPSKYARHVLSPEEDERRLAMYRAGLTDKQMAEALGLADGIKAFERKPDMTPEENHENWMRYKLAQGWRYGPVKDEDAKTHPDLVPFAELPDVEKRKDTMDIYARRFARRVLEHVGKVTAERDALLKAILAIFPPGSLDQDEEGLYWLGKDGICCDLEDLIALRDVLRALEGGDEGADNAGDD